MGLVSYLSFMGEKVSPSVGAAECVGDTFLYPLPISFVYIVELPV